MSSSTGVTSPKNRRRQSALVSLANKRNSITPTVVNLNCLVKVYLLDGSSKVLQMFDNSTAKDVLVSLRLNLDLNDISTFALFRVVENNVRRIDLKEKISDVLVDTTGTGKTVTLLFRSWIHYKNGVFYNDVFQDDERHPVANSALWLYYSEALFMCYSGKYYLNEEESLLLGCLRAQVESGDFNATRHSVHNMKTRISLRFPEPVCSRMKYLLSSDPPAADALAERAQSCYSHLVGKSREQAQIEFLRFLQTWCPFFGSTFYRVQCQYDPSPLDSSEASNPPVVGMTAAVGPQGICLLTHSESTLLRHPYPRIIKWIAHSDKHIFTYWVIKPEVRLSDIEQYQESSSSGSSNGKKTSNNKPFDPRPYCDCVYLVTPQVRELEHLVSSYVGAAVTGAPPSLPGAPEELRAPLEPDYEELYNMLLAESGGGTAAATVKKGGAKTTATAAGGAVAGSERRPTSSPVKLSRLSVFLSALGASHTAAADDDEPAEEVEEENEALLTGSGMALYNEEQQEGQQQEIGGVLSSLFKNMYTAPNAKANAATAEGGGDGDASLQRIPTSVRLASTLAELHKVASEEQFSDSDSDNDEPSSEEEEPVSEAPSSRPPSSVIGSSRPVSMGPSEPYPEDEEGERKAAAASAGAAGAGAVRRDSALFRASKAFFKAVSGGGGGGKKSKKNRKSDDRNEGDSGSDDDEEDDNDDEPEDEE